MRSMLIVAAAFLPICAAGQQVYRSGDPGVVAPELTSEVKAGYTARAFQRGIEGSVVLEGVVLETDNVGEVRVTQHLDDDLDTQAVDTVNAHRSIGTRDLHCRGYVRWRRVLALDVLAKRRACF